MLNPTYTASATFTGDVPGKLELKATDTALATTLAPFFKGDKGEPGAGASDAEIRAIAADQDTIQIFDYDALVAATLGV